MSIKNGITYGALMAAFCSLTWADAFTSVTCIDTGNTKTAATSCSIANDFGDASASSMELPGDIALIVSSTSAPLSTASASASFKKRVTEKAAYRVSFGGGVNVDAPGTYTFNLTVGSYVFPTMTESNGVPLPANYYVVVEPGQSIVATMLVTSPGQNESAEGFLYLTNAKLPPQ